MVDVARFAGCSRATLYRYFPNQESLHLAFVQRATLRIATRLAEERDAGAPDSMADRILRGIAEVRRDPLLAVWFEPENMAVPMAMTQNTELLRSLSAGAGTGGADHSSAHDGAGGPARDPILLRAEWLLRSIVSLLATPGTDAASERLMVESFVVPVLAEQPDFTRSR